MRVSGLVSLMIGTLVMPFATAQNVPPADGLLLYDPLGMLDPKRLHLGWLNKFLPLKAVPVTELDEWFRSL